MNLEKFIERYNRFNSGEFKQLSMEEIEKIICNTVEKYSDKWNYGHYNALKVMEELGELSQVISKSEIERKSGKMSMEMYYNLLEEMADVYLGLLCLKEIHKINDEEFLSAISTKANREDIRNKGLEI